MLRPGIEPVISFTGARDYARSAVASWTKSSDNAKAGAELSGNLRLPRKTHIP